MVREDFTPDELQTIQFKAHAIAETIPNPQWKREYIRLGDAANSLWKSMKIASEAEGLPVEIL